MATLGRRIERPPSPQIPGSRAKIPLNPNEEGTSNLRGGGGKTANRKLVRVRTQRVPVLQQRDERKSKDGKGDAGWREDYQRHRRVSALAADKYNELAAEHKMAQAEKLKFTRPGEEMVAPQEPHTHLHSNA